MKRKSEITASLSNDAKALMGTVFAMCGGPTLQFQMIESRPSKRCQAALDELVVAKIIVKDNLPTRADGSCGVSYKACWPGEDFKRFAKHGNFPIAEPIK